HRLFATVPPQVLVIGRYPGVADQQPPAFQVERAGVVFVSHGVPIMLQISSHIVEHLRLTFATSRRQGKRSGVGLSQNLGISRQIDRAPECEAPLSAIV
ncbi:hypothetical protein, partial [Enterobacter cloacae]|uniref:hypothetical protein n=2 Tax=Enterobacterales TaxID=91347 RepID=UPI001C10FB18